MNKLLILLLPIILTACSVDNTPCTVDVDEVYMDTMFCTGLYAEQPEVRFNDFEELGLGGAWGFHHVAGQIVFINTGYMGLGFEHTCETDIAVLRHEFIHHILHSNDMGDDSRNHTQSLFEPCGPFINTYN